MNENEAEGRLGLGIIYLVEGAGFGILVLLLWYLVFGAAGLTSASQLGITIPFTPYTLHHEIVGIFVMGLGTPLLLSENRYLFAGGLILFGAGGVWFLEDLIQHCILPNVQSGGIGFGSCQSWP